MADGRDSPRGHRVELRRSPWRLALAVAVRAAIGAAAVRTGLEVPDLLGAALVTAGGVVLAYAMVLGLFFATVRAELHPDELHVVSALRRRRYRLVRGPITRMAPRKRRLIDAQLSFLGVMLGRAEVGGERLAGILALGPAEYLVTIPTADGRLALALQSEEELLAALGR